VSARAAAFFDVDGTITHTTILSPLRWYQQAHLGRPRYALWWLGMLPRMPYYLWIDRRSRSECNRVFFRNYAGLPATDVRDWHSRTFAENLQRTLVSNVVEIIRDHRRQGHPIVFVTGGLEVVMRPLAEFLQVDELMATQLVERDGFFTGELDGPAIADEQKATMVREWARTHGIDLTLSYAYGNSMGDAPMLACVGNAVAVNPDGRLRRHARLHSWRTVRWHNCRERAFP